MSNQYVVLRNEVLELGKPLAADSHEVSLMIVREARLDDAPAIARVHVDTWQTAYRGIVPEDYLSKLSYKKRESSWAQMLSTAAENQHFIYVVEDGAGQIIAFADGGPERTSDSVYKGELYAIYVLETYQRQGIGRRLIPICRRKASSFRISLSVGMGLSK